jgi:hypothetical protein
MSMRAIGLILLTFAATATADIARTADGKPDLSGFFDIATLTPLTRPPELGDKQTISQAEAEQIAAGVAAANAAANARSDPNRGAPERGGDGTADAGGGVGGYNNFWLDFGSSRFQIDGEYRTSIITQPSNGQYPAMTPLGQQRMTVELDDITRKNTGQAWWLDQEGPGPYDDMELRPLRERCILGFGPAAGPPIIPSVYNNLKRIVQTEDYVMILAEMVHDARIIRLESEHAPAEITAWMGDSIGRWEGDTLVVETKNFKHTTGLMAADEHLHVTERFTRIDDQTLLYNFTVNDPTVWTEPWTGEYPWPQVTDKVYEYACHEGNYALGNIMRGARLLEREMMAGGGED